LTAPLRFTPDQRIRSPADYKRVYDLKRSVGDDRLLLFGAWNDLGRSRLGTSVSKKVGNSVRRHYLKRMIREAFRLSQFELPAGLDMVVIPRAQAAVTLDGYLLSIMALTQRYVRKWPH
jgi:ribonuclease P protein component